MRGNCLTYALGMLMAEGFVGRIEPGVLWGWPPKLRFYYVNTKGEKTYLYPLQPRAGWQACLHAVWFEGQIRRG